WSVSDEFIQRLDEGDKKALKMFKRELKVKAVTGKGYFFFPDKANRLSPQCYKDLGLDVKASQLCTEITLHSSSRYTYTCVLFSMNLSKDDECKDTTAVFNATVCLDCVDSGIVNLTENVSCMKKARDFTLKSMALGLGALGFHTYLQDK